MTCKNNHRFAFLAMLRPEKQRQQGREHADSFSLDKPTRHYRARAITPRPGFDNYGYPFQGLPNTRDLGSIPTQDGRHVKPGMLLRSGALDRGTAEDLDALVYRFNVRTVIDLREACTPESRDSTLLAGKQVECIDAGMNGMRALIPHPFRNANWAFAAEVAKMNLRPRAYQARMYRGILLDKQNQASLQTAFQALLSPHEEAILWHCSIGKDRTGLFSALLLHCLGVSGTSIMEDYLASKYYLTTFGDEDDRALREYGWPELMRGKVHETHIPRSEYLDAAWASIEREYGSIDAYLLEAIGIGSEERSRLQTLYLE